MASSTNDLAMRRIAIIGLGLIGGSLALALKGRCRQLRGFDPDGNVRRQAASSHLVDDLALDLPSAVNGADLIVLAAPVGAILQIIQGLPEVHTGKAVLLDLGSSKLAITRAMEALPARYDPIGGHPMCGKERLGLANADPALFQGATFALTPLPRTSARARQLASGLLDLIGARPLWVDPATHDRWVAATSHLPYLVAAALAQVTPLEAQPLVGPGFRSAARLAATPSSMMLDVLLTNRDNLLDGLSGMRQALEALHALLAAGDQTGLRIALEAAAARQAELVNPVQETGR